MNYISYEIENGDEDSIPRFFFELSSSLSFEVCFHSRLVKSMGGIVGCFWFWNNIRFCSKYILMI